MALPDPESLSSPSPSFSSSHASRRSLLFNLPNQFSSLIRSHSSSSRARCSTHVRPLPSPLLPISPAALQQPTTPSYADSLKFDQNSLLSSLDMFSTSSTSEEDRPTRKRSRTENRLYNFFTRSRSRSRSKNNIEPLDEPAPELPKGHLRHSSAGSTFSANKALPQPPPSGSKPPSRIPSRPLSSTTTGTGTTITPGTPKARRQPPSAIPAPALPSDAHEHDQPGSRPSTPKPSAARKKLHNLFGIPLGGPRKSSRSRSRTGSPRPSLDVPPLPVTPPYDDDPTPKPRKFPASPAPLPPLSPSPASRSKIPDSSQTALRLPKFFSARNADTQPLQRQPSTSAANPPSVSAPIKRPSQRRPVKGDSPVASSSTPPQLAIPAITHTPATPVETPSKASPVTPRFPASPSRPAHVLKGASLDAGYRYRGGNMGIVDEEGRTVQKGRSPKGKGKEMEAVPRAELPKISRSARATKHGSFDFERPGWGATMMQRAGSNGTSGTASTWSKEGGPKERESAWGPGMAGVGTLQRDISFKRSKDREDQVKKEREARKKREGDFEQIPSQRSTPHGSQSDHAHNSTSTNGTGVTGKSSSMSRATGKRSMFSSKNGRLGLSTQHGPFAFEPAVPSPTWSTGSSHDHHSSSWNGRGEKERVMDEKGASQRKGVQRGGDRPPVPVPLPPNVGHRSGTKGRSLDLGLGLSWAPSRMREDALLPSSTFARSASNSSSQAGRSASGSTNGHGTRTRRVQIDEEGGVERSKVGKEVAGLFRDALDADGYSAFKKYVHQFDAHEIPFEGSQGIVHLVERLLRNCKTLDNDSRRILLDNFIRIILQNA